MTVLSDDIKDIRNLDKQTLLELQVLLKLAGYFLRTDGIYGSETEAVFNQFKADCKLTKPYLLGRLTLETLIEKIVVQVANIGVRQIVQSQLNLNLIKQYEGCYLKAYKCPAGVWTIGYGNTHYLDGTKVKPEDKLVSKAEAEYLLEALFEQAYLPKLEQIPYWDEMSGNQRSALASFMWNLGPNFYGTKGFGTITAALKNKQWDKVPNILKMYRNPGSSYELGLLRRRIDEGNLWSTPDPAIDINA